MIDGVKIIVNSLNLDVWTNNPLLSFFVLKNTKTGEVKAKSSPVSDYNGLLFKYSASIQNGKAYYGSIRGSLSVFTNKGVPTTEQMSYQGLRAALLELQNDFGIDLDTSNFTSLELSANIPLPYSCDKIINSIIGHFSIKPKFENEAKYRGVIFDSENDYTIKIYDKGRNLGNVKANVLRVEIVLKKKRQLEKYGIYRVCDLLDKSKMEKLVDVFEEKLAELIYLDTMDFENLPPRLQEKMKDWSNAAYWNEVLSDRKNKTKKNREKEQFKEVCKVRGLDTGLNQLLFAIKNIWEKGLNEGSHFFGNTGHLSGSSTYVSSANVDNCLIKINRTFVHNDHFESELSVNEKTVNISVVEMPGSQRIFRDCQTCGKSLIDKKAVAKFCSKSCANKNSHQARKERLKIRIEKEQQDLLILAELRFSERSRFLIFKNGVWCSFLLSELVQFRKNEIKASKRLIYRSRKVNLELNTSRAKEAIRIIRAKRDII